MATNRFSALNDGQSVSFRPGVDLLSFDIASTSAADTRVDAADSGARIDVLSGAYVGKDLVPLSSTQGSADAPHSALLSSAIEGGSGIDFSLVARIAAAVNLAVGTVTGRSSATSGPGTASGGEPGKVLVGDAGSNLLTGGAGNDRLETGGSEAPPMTAVTDTLIGGLGDDTYVLHRNVGTYANARVVISDSGGTDTVIAHSGVWTLGSGLENLTLGFDWTSEGEAFGTGNSSNNVITGYQGWWVNNHLEGRSGNDSLRGGDGNDWLDGGAGTDVLTGGAGGDSFVFRTPGADRVTDFSAEADQLVFDNAVFTALGAEGDWPAGDARFRAAAGATTGADANDRIIYNTSTGSLYYDPDGSGDSSSQLIATLGNTPALSADDISVI